MRLRFGFLAVCAVGLVVWGGGCREAAETISTPEELRAAGLAKMEAGEYAAAREHFESLVVRAGSGAAEGLYLTGMTYFWQELYDDAFSRFEQLIDRYPASEWCDDAQFMKGECRFKGTLPLEKDQTKIDQALDEYNVLLEEYENTELAGRAQGQIKACRQLKAAKLLFVAKFYKKTGKYRAAAIYLNNIAEDYPDYDELAESQFLAGECYAQAGDNVEAAARFRDVLGRFPASSYAAPAAARLAALEK